LVSDVNHTKLQVVFAGPFFFPSVQAEENSGQNFAKMESLHMLNGVESPQEFLIFVEIIFRNPPINKIHYTFRGRNLPR